MKRIIILFVFFISYAINNVNAQKLHEINGMVINIDSIKYYKVYLVKNMDSCQIYVVLANRNSTMLNIHNCLEIQLGLKYRFQVSKISSFIGEDGINVLINHRGINYNETFVVPPGEFPYMAQNVINNRICE